ncbi:hypothetical protein O9G_000770 [Rozella allomycis CSF55]|uniref:Uncharacterized protein n=1 Tax=Rozella allomycis (strain CSF55) TaxID=988480 RepID=A0A075ARA6_ROZAC|nr:hypothetical protein O9G_000770 [Rozella allomycis CSF55]|eukprot:EPZ32695.1 hypothetical protein O9G_000770 [Rozella allomycis CSF55]
MSKEDFKKRVSDFVDQDDYENALKTTQEALEIFPNDIDILELYGVMLVENNEHEKALNVFTQNMNRSDASSTTFLFLGQLVEGMDSLNCYQKAYELLNPQDLNVKEKKVSILCAMAELYLSDLCEEENAEAACESYVNEAESIDPNNVEILVTKCSLRICQLRNDEAKEAIQKAYSKVDANKPETWPTYEIRTNMAKRLMETEFFTESLTILAMNQLENDEDVEVWFLFGWVYYLKKDYIESYDCLEQTLVLIEKLQIEDPAMLSQINEMKSEIETMGVLEENDNEEVEEMDIAE